MFIASTLVTKDLTNAPLPTCSPARRIRQLCPRAQGDKSFLFVKLSRLFAYFVWHPPGEWYFAVHMMTSRGVLLTDLRNPVGCELLGRPD